MEKRVKSVISSISVIKQCISLPTLFRLRSVLSKRVTSVYWLPMHLSRFNATSLFAIYFLPMEVYFLKPRIAFRVILSNAVEMDNRPNPLKPQIVNQPTFSNVVQHYVRQMLTDTHVFMTLRILNSFRTALFQKILPFLGWFCNFRLHSFCYSILSVINIRAFQTNIIVPIRSVLCRLQNRYKTITSVTWNFIGRPSERLLSFTSQ